MKVTEQNLNIEYDMGHDEELDKKIREFIKELGFTETGSGYTIPTRTRDFHGIRKINQ